MSRWRVAVVLAALSISGCATRQPVTPPPPPPPGSAQPVVGARCPPTAPCAPKDKSPYRQYYDAQHRRYYYYDPLKRRYFWENGQPKT
jgi:hypothetical protein